MNLRKHNFKLFLDLELMLCTCTNFDGQKCLEFHQSSKSREHNLKVGSTTSNSFPICNSVM